MARTKPESEYDRHKRQDREHRQGLERVGYRTRLFLTFPFRDLPFMWGRLLTVVGVNAVAAVMILNGVSSGWTLVWVQVVVAVLYIFAGAPLAKRRNARHYASEERRHRDNIEALRRAAAR